MKKSPNSKRYSYFYLEQPYSNLDSIILRTKYVRQTDLSATGYNSDQSGIGNTMITIDELTDPPLIITKR